MSGLLVVFGVGLNAADAAGVGEEHTEDNHYRNNAPDVANGFFGFFMKKETHSGTILPYA